MNPLKPSFPVEKQSASSGLFLNLLKERTNSLRQSLVYPVERFVLRKVPKPLVPLSSSTPSPSKDKSLKAEGKDQQVLNQATKKELDLQTVDDLVRKSNRVIISISSKIFPWDFFPDTIVVEESRVTFTFRQFLSSQSHSVDIKDISNVFIESSLFLATLRVVSDTFFQNDIKITNLRRKKAEKVRRIIEGLRTFRENNIDTSNYEIKELIGKLEQLHTTR